MKFHVIFTETDQSFTTSFQISKSFSTSFDKVITVDDLPHYDGEYTLVPKVTEQVFETRNKVMNHNILVKAIPLYNVSNTAGGNTIYIGNGVDSCGY